MIRVEILSSQVSALLTAHMRLLALRKAFLARERLLEPSCGTACPWLQHLLLLLKEEWLVVIGGTTACRNSIDAVQDFDLSLGSWLGDERLLLRLVLVKVRVEMGESLITELDCRSLWLGRDWLIAVVKHVRMLLLFEKLVASICLSERLSSFYPS